MERKPQGAAGRPTTSGSERLESAHQLSQASFIDLYRDFVIRRSPPDPTAESVEACVSQLEKFIAAEVVLRPTFLPRHWLTFAVAEDFTPLRLVDDWIPPGTMRGLAMTKALAYLHLVALIQSCLGTAAAGSEKALHLDMRRRQARSAYDDLITHGRVQPPVSTARRSTSGEEPEEAKRSSSDAANRKLFEMLVTLPSTRAKRGPSTQSSEEPQTSDEEGSPGEERQPNYGPGLFQVAASPPTLTEVTLFVAVASITTGYTYLT